MARPETPPAVLEWIDEMADRFEAAWKSGTPPRIADFLQGEAGDRFYLIARGGFEVLVDGQPQVGLGRGEYFGERALLQA